MVEGGADSWPRETGGALHGEMWRKKEKKKVKRNAYFT